MTFLMNSFLQPHVHELARDTSFYKSTTGLTVHTSDARAIGVASTTRRVYALIYGSESSIGQPSATLVSATIGGIAATIHVQNSGPDAEDTTLAAIVSATVPTGTTAVVTATFSKSFNRFACAVIALDNLDSTTPFDTLATSVEAENEISGALDYAAWGYVMALVVASVVVNTQPTCTWSGPGGIEETADDYIEIFNSPNFNYNPFSVAFIPITQPSTGNTLTATYNFPATEDMTLVAISVR